MRGVSPLHTLQSFLLLDETHGIMFTIILFYSKVPSKSYMTLDNTLHLKKKPNNASYVQPYFFWLIFVYSLKLKLKNCMTGYLEEPTGT